MMQNNGVSPYVELGLPLSSEQRQQAAADGTLPAVFLQLDLHGDVQVQRLQDAWHAVLRRHAILRHAFGLVSGYRGLRQQALAEPPSSVWQVQPVREDERQHWQQQSFDLLNGQVVRAGLLDCGDRCWQFWLAASPLVADSRSLLQLAADLRQHYLNTDVADEAFAYADYVEWRQSLDDDVDAGAGQAYWANYAQQALQAQAPRLSCRREAVPGVPPQHGVSHAVLPAALAASLQDWAGQHQVTPETVLHAAWLSLLGKLTQVEQVRSAWQHDCRADYEPMAQAVGLYEKLFPLALTVSPQHSFGDVVQQLALLAERHTGAQEYMSDDVAAAASAEIGFAAVTLNRVWNDAGLTWRAQLPALSGQGFELALLVNLADPAHIALQLHSAAQCYREAAMTGLLQQYQAFLAQALQHSAAPLATLHWDDQSLWPQRLSAQPLALDIGRDSVLAHIERQALATPQAIALSGADGSAPLDYATLMTRVNQLAHWLREQGAGAQTRVALALRRSPQMVVALLAVWRAGAAYVPIDLNWPAARRASLLQDAMPLLVLHEHGSDDLGGTSLRQVVLDDLQATLQHYPTQAPVVASALSDAAYVLYTSGSTGIPKGVVIEHGQLLNYVAAAAQGMQLQHCRCWGLTSTVAADLGNTALFIALFHGAELAIADDNDMQDGVHFAAFLRRRQVDALKIVPSHLEALLDTEDASLPQTIVLGGEAAAPALIRKIWQRHPDCRVFNHYGPTETTVGVMWHRFSKAEVASDDGDAVIPLTEVMANCRVAVLDASLQTVPMGAVGQLYIGGAQRCRGYLNQANTAAAAAFVSDPHDPQQSWYRSGDLACYLPQGGVRILGRADDQVKIRGFRIEPAEVEAALLQQAGVRQAVVLAHAAPGEASSLTACIVADTAQTPWAGDPQAAPLMLRNALLAILPEPMVPARYVLLPAFPRLANGKIDRRALLQSVSVAAAQEQTQATELAADDLEFVVLDAMAQLLPAAQGLGRHGDFIAAGGHSLLAIKLVARLRKLLRIEIAPAMVFDHATPATLAAALRAQTSEPEQLAQLEQLATLRRSLLEMPAAEREALLEQV
jgi:amino acid adenylation domain-containing protein